MQVLINKRKPMVNINRQALENVKEQIRARENSYTLACRVLPLFVRLPFPIDYDNVDIYGNGININLEDMVTRDEFEQIVLLVEQEFKIEAKRLNLRFFAWIKTEWGDINITAGTPADCTAITKIHSEHITHEVTVGYSCLEGKEVPTDGREL